MYSSSSSSSLPSKRPKFGRGSHKRQNKSPRINETDGAGMDLKASAWRNSNLSDRVEQLECVEFDRVADKPPSLPRNPLFERFYSEQAICPPDEWPQFISALQAKLPITFRFSTINGLHKSSLAGLLSDRFELSSKELKFRSFTIPPPALLSWYPDHLAWQFNAAKNDLKNVSGMAEFRAWLMMECDEGNLNRQEAVSMIPPLLLDVKPHHRVLDVAAAPGSKTAQLLESLHSNADGSAASPSGMIVANDSDSRRAYMLVHQLKRLGSPNFLVTTHEGQFFPNLFKTRVGDEKLELIEFDRILCDVPCSGDGTLRKNLNLWKSWTFHAGSGLHALQLSIVTRSAAMLKVGGSMVYSTCSFNPIENEAVLAELLRRSEGALELVDCSDRLAGLKRMPGLNQWKVPKGTEKGDFEWAELADFNDGENSKIRRSMFPPTADEASKFHLERAIRILPQQQNTGGFFIALLNKVRLMPMQAQNQRFGIEKALKTDEIKGEENEGEQQPISFSTITAGEQNSSQHNHSSSFQENAFIKLHSRVVDELVRFYGLHSVSHENFFSRSDSNKRCYFVGPAIAEIFECQKNNGRLKVVHSGARVYERNSGKTDKKGNEAANTANANADAVADECDGSDASQKCQYRVVQEGVDWLAPFMTRQRVSANLEQFLFLLERGSVAIKHYQIKAEFGHQLVQDKFASEIIKADCGSLVVVLECADPRVARVSAKNIALCAWKSENSLTAMMQASEKNSLISILKQCFNDNNANNSASTSASANESTSQHKVADEQIGMQT